MADIISGEEIQGNRCCYRDRGIIVEFLIEKISFVRAEEEEVEKIDHSGLFFVH